MNWLNKASELKSTLSFLPEKPSYSTVDAIHSLTDVDELEAFEKGLHANKIKPWLNSFIDQNCYNHSLAYYSGVKLSDKGNSVLKDEVARRKAILKGS